MKNNIADNEALRDCTGCGVCASICGVNAIALEIDVDGFYKPVVDNERCVECGLCKKSCYRYDMNVVMSDWVIDCYAAINKNEQQLIQSSSGGISRLLMEECISKGYKVLGCIYDLSENKARSIIVSSLEDLDQFYGSKYFQSYTVDGFREVLMDRSEQKYALFGTPCQIYGFAQCSKYRRNPDRFLLVDLFCHGCPTKKLWDKYQEGISQQLGNVSFNKIAFRSKTYGWHEYCIDFWGRKGRVSSKKNNDPFFDLFFGADVMNRACYSCKLRSTMYYADIRLGDYWGVKYELNTKGVSAVMIGSMLGKRFIDSVMERMIVEKADFHEIISAQSYGKSYVCNEKRRSFLMQGFDSHIDIYELNGLYRKMLPVKVRIKKAMKTLIKLMPQSCFFALRKILHSI